jgi:hypothetical protein
MPTVFEHEDCHVPHPTQDNRSDGRALATVRGLGSQIGLQAAGPLRNAAFDGFAQKGKSWRDRMAFGHYLRRQWEERGMTLTELARRVEISIAYLSRIERERENPPPDHLISALAGALSPVWASHAPRTKCQPRQE